MVVGVAVVAYVIVHYSVFRMMIRVIDYSIRRAPVANFAVGRHRHYSSPIDLAGYSEIRFVLNHKFPINLTWMFL